MPPPLREESHDLNVSSCMLNSGLAFSNSAHPPDQLTPFSVEKSAPCSIVCNKQGQGRESEVESRFE